MIYLALSAAFVGLVHSLAPGHWLPVVLVSKTRRWSLKKGILGAVISASGHIVLSIGLALIAIQVGAHLFIEQEATIERYAGLAVGVFGLIYAAFAFFRHSSCHGHTHHGPDPKGQKDPYLFLFLTGFSPCIAALPLFGAAATLSSAALVFTLAAFAAGVLAALIGATVLVSFGIMKLDHPILEHYGDVITGLGVALMGLALFLFSHELHLTH